MEGMSNIVLIVTPRLQLSSQEYHLLKFFKLELGRYLFCGFLAKFPSFWTYYDSVHALSRHSRCRWLSSRCKTQTPIELAHYSMAELIMTQSEEFCLACMCGLHLSSRMILMRLAWRPKVLSWPMTQQEFHGRQLQDKIKNEKFLLYLNYVWYFLL